LYYPEFKLYERPYLLLEYDTEVGNNVIYFDKTTGNDLKNLAFLNVGEILYFKDYDVEYNIFSITELVNSYEVYLDRNLDEPYFKNDIILFRNLKYELQANSNILNDSTASTLSPFKIKFIETFDAKS